MNTTLDIVAPDGTEWNVGIEGIVDAAELRSYMDGQAFIPEYICWGRFSPRQPDGWHKIRQIRPYDGDAVLRGWPASKVLTAFKKAYDKCWGKPISDTPSELQYEIYLLRYRYYNPLKEVRQLSYHLRCIGLVDVSEKLDDACKNVQDYIKTINALLDKRTTLQCRARYWEEVDQDER